MKKSIVKLRNTGTQFYYPESGEYLLEVLELHAIEVEYQCRSGYCGACRLKLVQGNVTYCQLPLALINAGEILPCCCMPITSIELEI
ncbi:Uncharacterized ferredoxin-like protein YfaE [Serratia symbiotica]|nr:Uncharacterized ferredoxin-like protein YfaE [Serratia symbiotica]